MLALGGDPLAAYGIEFVLRGDDRAALVTRALRAARAS